MEGIGEMSFRVFWFVVAGFVLGFTTSTLWEWLYYRRRRLQLPTQYDNSILERARNRIAESDPDSLTSSEWTVPTYRSPAVFLETEDTAHEEVANPHQDDLPMRDRSTKHELAPAQLPSADLSPDRSSRSPTPLPQIQQSIDEDSQFREPPPSIAAAAAAAAATLRESTPELHVEDSHAGRKSLEEAADTGHSQIDTKGSAFVARPMSKHSASESDIALISGLGSETSQEVEKQANDQSVEQPANASHTQSRQSDYPDDLAMVRGIGIAYKRRLYGARIYTWRQLAESDTESLRRITRAKPNADIGSWQTQAHDLATKYGRLQAQFSGPLDDFMEIEGIGAITADILYKAGICTYEALMKTSPDELARLVPAPTVGNENDFDGWVTQAATLAATKQTDS